LLEAEKMRKKVEKMRKKAENLRRNRAFSTGYGGFRQKRNFIAPSCR